MRALELASEIAENAPLAVQASKRVAYGVRDGRRAVEHDAWDQTTEEIVALAGTEDFLEGPIAFAEKRPPVWKAR